LFGLESFEHRFNHKLAVAQVAQPASRLYSTDYLTAVFRWRQTLFGKLFHPVQRALDRLSTHIEQAYFQAGASRCVGNSGSH
jgi:hypothetical protein